MANSHKTRTLSTKKIVVLVLVGILLIAVASAGAYYYYSQIQSANNQAKKEPTTQEKIDSIIAEADTSSGNADTQKQKLQQLADSEPDKEKKAQYLSARTDLYINTGDTTGAVEAAKTYEQSDESALSAAALAKTYEDAGDFANAAKYYGIAAERSPKPISPQERAPYNEYMHQKEVMEAKL